MLKYKWVKLFLSLLIVLSLMAVPSISQAQEAGPRYLLNTASYTFLLSFDSNLVQSGVAASIRVEFDQTSIATSPQKEVSKTGLALTLGAQKTDEPTITVAPIILQPQSDGWHGQLNFSQPGNWVLELNVVGPEGSQKGGTAIVVAPPPALPLWVAWLVAVSPLLIAGFLMLAARQLKFKQHRRKEKVV